MDRSSRCFQRDYLIRFSHCDPAGIVFFPQYLVLFNNLVEDWFNDGLSVFYHVMLDERRIGLPTVHLECDFRAISRMGDVVTFGLGVERVGSKSLILMLDACAGTELRAACRQVLVFTDLNTHRSIEIPADVRTAVGTLSLVAG